MKQESKALLQATKRLLGDEWAEAMGEMMSDFEFVRGKIDRGEMDNGPDAVDAFYKGRPKKGKKQ